MLKILGISKCLVEYINLEIVLSKYMGLNGGISGALCILYLQSDQKFSDFSKCQLLLVKVFSNSGMNLSSSMLL
jgi:hypothetical protein